MKNTLKLAKIAGLSISLVTLAIVTFFITSSLVLAWVGPSESPPGGNPPGFIFNKLITEDPQPASINIAGAARVNELRVNNNASLIGSLTVGDSICFRTDENCISDWPDFSGGNLWAASGNNIYNTNLGNVGIGNTNPDVKLVVGDGLNSMGNIIGINGVDTTYTGYRLQTAGSEKWFIGMDDAALNNDLIFRRNGSSNDVVIKNNTGNVGIGTINPAAKLEVAGQIKITGGNPGTGKVLVSDGTGLASWQTPTSGLPAGTAGQTLRYDGTSWVASSNLYNNGINIGIGVTSPDSRHKVEIKGVNSGLEVVVPAGNYGGGPETNPVSWNRAGHFKISGTYGSEVYLATSPYFANWSYGVYGIGYTAGVYGEGTAGAGVIGKGSSGVPGVLGETSGGGIGVRGNINSYLDEGGYWQGGKGVGGLGYGNYSYGVYGLAGPILISCDDYGNCIYQDYPYPGVGVFGEGQRGATGVKGSSAQGWSGYFSGGKGLYTDKLCLGSETDCKANWLDGSFWLPQSGTNNIYSSNTGNVGIGTQSPRKKLDVFTAADSDGIRVRRGNNTGLSINMGSTNPWIDYVTGITFIPTTYANLGNWVWSPANPAPVALHIASNSNVGIGTTNPGEKLQVVGDIKLGGTEGNIKDVNAIIGYDDLFLKGNSAENAPVHIAGSQLSFWSGGAERIRVTSAGNIGIGTTNPAKKLDIAGQLRLQPLSKGVCDSNNTGVIAYEEISNVGHFYGCVKTSATTYSWKQLDN